MKTLNYVIVELNKAYNNEIEVSTGESVIINSTIESVQEINRVATVVSAPSFTILEKGDKVVVHHNVFRLRNGTKGNVIKSDYNIEDDLYFVPLTEIFMYKRDSDWEAISPYCFVKPIMSERVTEGFSLSKEENTHKGYVKRRGIMSYPNKDLLEQGLTAGDRIAFSEYSEYEFLIEGELYYKMATRDILFKE